MSNRIKRGVALWIVTLWVALFGICFSEEFGYLRDTPENADQAVEQALSLPADRVVYLSDELPGLFTPSGFMIAIEAVPLSPPQSVPFILRDSERTRPPSRVKLFQLLSTYRI